MLRPSVADLATRPIANRAPNTHPDNVPESRDVHGPAAILEDTEVATQWTPYFLAIARPYFGGHDPLSESGHGVMHVAQADMYDPSANDFPNNGQFDRPNAIAMVGIMRLRPHTSAHPGAAMSTKRGDPTSLFRTPPIFSLQTQPVPAVGV